MSETTIPATVDDEVFKRIIQAGYPNPPPDFCFVLSGGTVLDSRTSKRRSCDYYDKDKHGLITGGVARVIAASYLAMAYPTMQFVTTSVDEGYPETEGSCSHAQVMKKELMERGVEEPRIHLEERSVCTFTELKEMVRIATNLGWIYVGLLSNDYHLPRIGDMYRYLRKHPDQFPDYADAINLFADFGINVCFLPAETINCTADPDYATELNEVMKTAGYLNRLQAEAQGREDLRTGKYKLR